MNIKTVSGKENLALDVIKMACAIIVAASHLPKIFRMEVTNFYFKQWFFRFCVPLFFISSGYFFFRTKNKLGTIKRVFWLFALSYVLYLPEILETIADFDDIFSLIRWYLIFGYGHLWYLNAALQGMLLWYLVERIPPMHKVFQIVSIPLCVALLLLGALLDEHYRLTNGELVHRAGELLLNFGGPRNVVFMGFPLLVLGGGLAQYEEHLRKIPSSFFLLGWIVFRFLAFLECRYLLNNLGMDISCDLSFFGIWPAFFLFMLSFRIGLPIPKSVGKLLRKLSEYVYVLHPLVASVISTYVVLSPIGLWILTIVMCSLIYILLAKQVVTGK